MRSSSEAATRGRGLAVAASVVAMALACTAKVFPAADTERLVELQADAGSSGAVTLGDGGIPEGADAGAPEQERASVVGSAVAPATVIDAGCTLLQLHRDRDGDGFGSAAPEDTVQGCSPLEGFVIDATDCHDAEHTGLDPAGDVFPGQTAFFTSGYPTASGISFDYDCSQHEEADPDDAFVPAPINCEDRAPPLCGADLGYVMPVNARSGDGVDPLCGVRQRGLCTAASADECGLNLIGASAPYPCR